MSLQLCLNSALECGTLDIYVCAQCHRGFCKECLGLTSFKSPFDNTTCCGYCRQSFNKTKTGATLSPLVSSDAEGPQGGPDPGPSAQDSQETKSNTTDKKHKDGEKKKGKKRSKDDPSRQSGSGGGKHDSAQDKSTEEASKRSKAESKDRGAVDRRSQSSQKSGSSKMPRSRERSELPKKPKTMPEHLPVFTAVRPPQLTDVSLSDRFRQRNTYGTYDSRAV